MFINCFKVVIFSSLLPNLSWLFLRSFFDLLAFTKLFGLLAVDQVVVLQVVLVFAIKRDQGAPLLDVDVVVESYHTVQDSSVSN